MEIHHRRQWGEEKENVKEGEEEIEKGWEEIPLTKGVRPGRLHGTTGRSGKGRKKG